MPATPANIARATRAAQIVTRTDSAIKALYPGARDALTAPDPGYFENAADAAAALVLKAALVGEFRRRWAVPLGEEYVIDPLTGIPTMTLIDSELGVNAPVLVTRFSLDLETETATLEVVG
jgi:hypothetical protein